MKHRQLIKRLSVFFGLVGRLALNGEMGKGSREWRECSR